MELQRYGRAPEGFPYILTALPDGYWTPWHVADAERLRLQRLAEQQRLDLENVAMMLRVCAHRLRTSGRADLSDKAVDLLRRLGLQGSPLREG